MCRKLALAATAVLMIAAAPAAFAADRQPSSPAKSTAAKPVKASKAEREMAERADPATRAEFWSTQVGIDPNDGEAGLKLASALRAMGQWDKAADTAEDVTIRHPDNEEAFLDLARAALGGGDGFAAVQPLKQAQILNPRDWRPLSLLGVAYEQTSRDDDAAQAYGQALALAPANPGVLTNFALFKLGNGDTSGAESLLRQAVGLPGANQQTRQNLAYVLGREGRLDEAEKLMRQDLPPSVVSNNLAYLQAILEKPAPAARTWDALKSDGG